MNNRSRNNTVSISVIAGSLCLELASTPEVVHADATVVADVSKELGRVRPARPSLVVPLARGETTLTLIEKAVQCRPKWFKAFLERMRSLTTVGIEEGLGMLRTLGLAAVEVAVRERDLRQRIYKELIVPLLRKNNGTLTHVEIPYFSSMAGGTGGPAARALAERVAEILHEHTGATVTLSGVQIGAVTFVGLGERIFRNGSVTAIEQLAYTLDPNRHPRESRYLILAELPTIDSTGQEIDVNRELRSLLAITLAGALHSRAVQEQILTGRSNRSLAHRYGALVIARASWYSLVRSEAIGSAAALHYAGEVERLSHQTLPPAVEAIRVETSPAPGSCPPKSVEELIEIFKKSKGMKPPLFEEECLASSAVAGELRVRSGGRDLVLDRLIPRVADIESLQRYWAESSRLYEVKALIDEALEDARKQEAELQRTLDKCRWQLLRAIEGLFPNRPYEKIESFFLGFGSKVGQFRRAFEDYHALQRRYADVQAQIETLEAGLNRIRQAIGALEELHRRLKRTLEALAAGVDGELPLDFQPLSAVYGELIGMVRTGDVGRLRLLTFLSKTARAMGIEGLAKAAGSEPTAEGVARRLLMPPLYEGPFWGGEEPNQAPFLRLIVLPPVDDALREQIQEAAAHCGMTHGVVSADTPAGGTALLMIELYPVWDAKEILPQAYRTGLKEALTIERDLYPITERARQLAVSLLGNLDQSQDDGSEGGKGT